MKLKNIWLEFSNKVLPLYGMISVLLVISSLIIENFDLTTALVGGYIYVTITYYLNFKILVRYINMKGDKIIFYIVYIVETVIYVIILKLRIDLINLEQICFYCLFRAVGIVVVGMSVFSAIVFFLQKAYTKRTNQKLNEYKQKPDDDTTQ